MIDPRTRPPTRPGATSLHLAAGAGLALGLACGPAGAQDGAAATGPRTWVIFRDESPPPRAEWDFQLEPLVWYAGAAGRLRFSGSSDSVKVQNLNLDSPRVTPGAEAHLALGAWRFTLGGFDFSTDDRQSVMDQAETIGGLAIAPGDRTESSLRLSSAQASAAYPLLFAQRPARTTGGAGVTATLDGVVGARIYSVDSDVRVSPAAGGEATLSGDSFFAEPIAGIKGELLISRWLTLDVETTFGGLSGVAGGSSFSWDIVVGIVARPIENVGVQVGYRQLVMELAEDEEDGFEFSGSLAGLYAGVTIRF